MNTLKSSLLVAAGILLASAAQAQSSGSGASGGLLLSTDVEFGGDTVATVSFENGDTQDVDAGQGVSVGIGGWVRPSDKVPLEISGSLGIKYVTTAADNADIHLSRTVLKLNASYLFANDWFVSAGLTRHMSPKLDGDGFFENIRFDDATGFSAEAGWRWISLRYTNIKYSIPGFEDVDASSIGVCLTWHQGLKR